MIRTYKSKKEITGGVDRKALLQNLDEKSSAFDAFYIQNIKQTKRELSSVGSLNNYGAASNKVRKRKYVRRIVKEVEVLSGDSLSKSTFLTPDKSLRVNKPLDPFDMLLNSSLEYPVDSVTNKVETITNKDDLFDKLLAEKGSRECMRQKPIRAKTYNSFSSDESDKENFDEKLDIMKNTSDIRTHGLIIEHDTNNIQKPQDDSINAIANNVSLLNKLRVKKSCHDSPIKSFESNRNRLTENIQSPILQNSGYCSTPFKFKYRDESIYKFSPILGIQKDESLACLSKSRDGNNINYSFLNLDKENVSPKISQEYSRAPIHKISGDDTAIENNNHIVNEIVETEAQNSKVSIYDVSEDNNVIGSNSHIVNEEVESEAENSDMSDIIHDIEEFKISQEDEISVEYSIFETTEIQPFIGFSNSVTDVNESVNNKDTMSRNVSEIEKSDKINNGNSKLNTIIDENSDETTSESLEFDNVSLCDTCSSEESCIESKFHIKELNVQLERLNDLSFLKYYEKMPEYYYNEGNTSEYNNSDSINVEESEEFVSFSNSSSNNSLDYIENMENEETSSEDETESNSNSDEEKSISFVTTRRKNVVRNNSIISIFDVSHASTSTDFNITVLSNKIDENKDILKISSLHAEIQIKQLYNDKKHESIENPLCPDIIPKSQETELVEDELRNSFKTTEKSFIQAANSIINSRVTGGENCEISLFSEERNQCCSYSKDIRKTRFDAKQGIVLQPGKKWERSLSIYRRMTMMTDHFDQSIIEDEHMDTKGRKYRQSVISTMELQELNGTLHNESINSRRSTFVSKPCRSTIRIVKDPNVSRISVCNSTTVFDDLKGFLNEECDDTIIELSKLSIAEQTHEVTVIDNFHDTSGRLATARDYVLRRCNQTDAILFDECYPDTVLKNCHKIGEGVYGEVFLWRDRDGRARVLKIIPIAGNIKVNGESQKDFHEIISEIVIAMELSALRAPIAEIERHFDEGKNIDALDLHAIENATDIFNEVLAVRCVYGSYPSRLLDLWDLYDECKGSENDNPAILPVDQQYIVLELANAGQDLESYQFNSAEQAHALFLQVAYGLAVAEEAVQFEHRDLHWGNVLIAPTNQKFATFVIRGRAHRVCRCGVAATIIDYSLSRVTLPLSGDCAALYNDLAADDGLFDAVGDYQFEVYRLMRDKLGNDWKNFEPYTNILWLHYTVDKMITALRYKRTNTKIHKHYIDKLKGIKSRILDYGSAALFVLTDNEI